MFDRFSLPENRLCYGPAVYSAIQTNWAVFSKSQQRPLDFKLFLSFLNKCKENVYRQTELERTTKNMPVQYTHSLKISTLLLWFTYERKKKLYLKNNVATLLTKKEKIKINPKDRDLLYKTIFSYNQHLETIVIEIGTTAFVASDETRTKPEDVKSHE